MEEKSLKILSVQMSSIIGDKKSNYFKVEELIKKDIFEGVDIVILPEVWAVGWSCKDFKQNAEDIENSETVAFLSKIARKYNVNIIGGSFITKNNFPKTRRHDVTDCAGGKIECYYNTCPVINRNGKLVATYDKMHLFSYYGCMEGSYVERGDNPVLVDIDGVKIGLSICYDIRFPEIYRAYAKNGADMLINMAAWPMSRANHWEVLTKARAIENQCFVIGLTQSGLIEGDEWNLGHSRVIDFNGDVVSEIKQGEGTMFAEIKFDDMYEFRKKCTVLLDIKESYDIK